MMMLAALDLGGTYAAKESVERKSVGFAIVGVFLWVLAFAIYVEALEYVDLTPITLGWVVAVQIGVVLLDRFRYDVTLPQGWPVAVALILAGQAYLLLGPTGDPGAVEPPLDPRAIAQVR